MNADAPTPTPAAQDERIELPGGYLMLVDSDGIWSVTGSSGQYIRNPEDARAFAAAMTAPAQDERIASDEWQIARIIIRAMQFKEFGHRRDNGDFGCTTAEIDLLSSSAAEAAREIASALRAATPSPDRGVVVPDRLRRLSIDPRACQDTWTAAPLDGDLSDEAWYIEGDGANLTGDATRFNAELAAEAVNWLRSFPASTQPEPSPQGWQPVGDQVREDE